MANKKCWGIDIGSTALKAVLVSRQKSQVVIEDFITIPFKKVATKKDEKAAIAQEALTELVSAKKIGNTPVVVSMMGQNAFNRFFKLPPVKKGKIPELVGFEARQQIPFDLSEVIWDYQVVSELEQFAEIDVSLFAIKRDVVEDFLETLAPFNFNIDALQLNSLAAYNFVAYDWQVSGVPLIILDIGAQHTEFVIVNGDSFYVRKLPMSGDTFTKLLSSKFSISEEEAVELKLSMSDSKQATKLQRVLAPKWKDFAGEIQRSVGYYKTIWKDLKVDNLALMGQTSQLNGFDEFLRTNLGFNVVRCSELKTLTVNPGLDQAALDEQLLGLGGSIGLGIQGVGLGKVGVSLMPPALVQAKALRAKRPIAAVALVLILIAMGIMFMTSSQEYTKVSEFKEELESTEKKTSKKKDAYRKLREQLPPLHKELDYFASIYESRNLSTDVYNVVIQMLKDNNIKLISLTSEQVLCEGQEEEEEARQEERPRGGGLFGGGAGRARPRDRARQARTLEDLSMHCLRYRLEGRILTGREITETKVTKIDADTKEALDEPIEEKGAPQVFPVNPVDVHALNQKLVKVLQEQTKPVFKDVELIDFVNQIARFESLRQEKEPIIRNGKIEMLVTGEIKTVTEEKYKTFTIVWESAE